MKARQSYVWRTLLCLALSGSTGCQAPEERVASEQPTPASEATPPPPILVDGSSTVHPISAGVLDLYASRLVTDVNLDFSGTGGGFKKFCDKAIDINAASRPISPSEIKACQRSGVEYIELPIAFDAVVVAVPRSATFVDFLTVAELAKLWSPKAEGEVMSWKDVRATFPDEPIRLFAPGIASGTFDFFTLAVLGAEGRSRSDYTASEDDAELTRKIAGTAGALGYLGLAQFAKATDGLRAVPIDDGRDDNGKGPILPSAESVTGATYQPLARPLFLYVSKKDAERPEVADFVNFYLRTARLVAPDVGAVGLPRDLFELATRRFERRQLGSAFHGLTEVVGLSLADLMSAEEVVLAGGSDKSQARSHLAD